MASPGTVVLVGKLGHGKTSIVNKICGTNYASQMQARSCTTSLQCGLSNQYGIKIIDTPGLYSSEGVANHISNQKLALENTPLSGIYIVVKFGRADEMAETVGKVMDFVGDDDVRIIVTHADFASEEARSHRERLSELLEVQVNHIVAVGKQTSSAELEDFIHSTLHFAKNYEVSKEQFALVSTLCVGARKFHQVIEQTSAKLQVSTFACQDLRREAQGRETDLVFQAIVKAATLLVTEARKEIMDGAHELALEEQSLLRKKLENSLELQQDIFTKVTKEWLSHLPSCLEKQKRTLWEPSVRVEYHMDGTGWQLEYMLHGSSLLPRELLYKLKQNLPATQAEEKRCSKRDGPDANPRQRKQRRCSLPNEVERDKPSAGASLQRRVEPLPLTATRHQRPLGPLPSNRSLPVEQRPGSNQLESVPQSRQTTAPTGLRHLAYDCGAWRRITTLLAKLFSWATGVAVVEHHPQEEEPSQWACDV